MRILVKIIREISIAILEEIEIFEEKRLFIMGRSEIDD